MTDAAEPAGDDVEALTRVVRPWTLCDDGGRFDHGSERAARAVLASDWLAARDAQIKAETLRELAREVRGFDNRCISWRGIAERADRLAPLAPSDEPLTPPCGSPGCPRDGYIKSERFGRYLCPHHASHGPDAPREAQDSSRDPETTEGEVK